jgi:hypothetical protein
MGLSRNRKTRRGADERVNRLYRATVADADLSEALRGRAATDYVWDETQRKFVLVYADDGRQTARANRETAT